MSVADGTQTVIEPPQTDGPNGPVRWYPYTVTWSPDGTTLLYTAWSDAPGAPSDSGVIAVPADTPSDVTVLTDTDVDPSTRSITSGSSSRSGAGNRMMLTPRANRQVISRAQTPTGSPLASKRRPKWSGAVAVGLLLTTAACGDDDGDGTVASTMATTGPDH